MQQVRHSARHSREGKAKSDPVWDIQGIFLPLEPLKLGYRVFYIIVLANARKIGLFLFYKLMEGRVKHLEMVKLAASKKFKDSISIRMWKHLSQAC